jgi:hypothetical protein
VSSLPRPAADNEPLLSRYDRLDIRDRDDEYAGAKDAAPDEQLIRPVKARAEPDRLDQAETPGRRVDSEAFAPAQPIVAVP